LDAPRWVLVPPYWTLRVLADRRGRSW
jgi:hypothetical protein